MVARQAGWGALPRHQQTLAPVNIHSAPPIVRKVPEKESTNRTPPVDER
jgi:hypothetical protein